ncbi:MAG: KH domain-containing protein [Deltaproteobacteria bacterium]|nr:KH domain-containing protein [Deltaproteobacteria bacterium]
MTSHEDSASDDSGSEDSVTDLMIYLARQLVDEPDAVEVEAIEGDRAIVYELTVAPDDLGKVIGRDGRTARALRALLTAASSKVRKRSLLEILE